MAPDKSIQVDEGDFTRLHNTILDKLALARFTASEYRCLMFLFRQTYGWQKKEDAISLGQWAKGTGIDPEKRHNVLRTLQGLIAKNVIYAKEHDNNYPTTWGFNKHWKQWDASLFEQGVISPDNTLDSQGVITGDNRGVISPDNRSVITGDNNKRKKETIKESTATQLAERKPTPQQEIFAAVCEAIGWDHKTLSKRDKGEVAQACGVLTKAEYTVDDIRRFMTDVWFRDWRWTKEAQHPTLKQLRQEIGKVRSAIPGVAPPAKTKGINGFRDMLAQEGIDL